MNERSLARNYKKNTREVINGAPRGILPLKNQEGFKKKVF